MNESSPFTEWLSLFSQSSTSQSWSSVLDVQTASVANLYNVVSALTEAPRSSEMKLVHNIRSTSRTASYLSRYLQYRQLGEAISEMKSASIDDEWKIDDEVYDSARRVALELLAYDAPTPDIFNHGSKSVVFKWSADLDNLYLTIGAGTLSALISSPERIKSRREYSFGNLLEPIRGFAALNATAPLKLTSESSSDTLGE